MTINSFTDCTARYETTLDDCECGDHQYRNHVCKHMEALRRAYERARAATFQEQWQKFDVRSDAVREAKRANYYYYEQGIGA